MNDTRWADETVRTDEPLREARRLQRQAAGQGFDWGDLGPMWDKLAEEVDELKESVECHGHGEIEAEIGDLLFMVVNLCRALNVEPQRALTATNEKFLARMRHIEAALERRGESVSGQPLERLEALWQQAKAPPAGITPDD